MDPFDRLRDSLAGRYQLERELGSGGMATVYLATDVRHRRQVAVKVLRADVAASIGSTRFLREIEISAGLVHPHILTVHDSGEVDGVLFFVMPFVEGESLRQRLRRDVRIALAESVRIVREVADALAHAHARGVVHRDIKPENILFESGHAVVSDFGVARAVTAAGDDALTMTGVVVGTPAYMSPEQATGARDLDHRCDVYSLGCVAFEMITGEHPFSGPSAHAILARKLSGTAQRVADTNVVVPAAVDDVLQRAIATKAHDRYASVAEFAAELAMAANDGAATSGRMPRLPRLPRNALLTVVAVAAVIVAAVLWTAMKGSSRSVRSIAVLPFDRSATDSMQPYVVEGIHDEIIGELGKIAALRVTSRTSVMAVMKDRAARKTIPQIARELDVDAVVEAAIYRSHDSVRIQLRLVQAVPEERQLWSRTYVTEASKLGALHTDIARGIVDELRVALTPQEESRLGVTQQGAGEAQSSRPEAYDQYLLGKFWLNRRTAEGIARADTAFRRAISLDDRFAAAHAGLATTLAMAVDWHYTPLDPVAASREGVEEANRAIALDPQSADAYAARGRILSAANAPEALVRADFERAIAIAPHHANAHGWYGMELAWRGNAAESRAENAKSIALDPLAPGRHLGFIISALNIGDLDVALNESRRVVALEPSINTGRYMEGIALVSKGLAAECLAVPLGRYASVKAICTHEIGRPDEARRFMDSVSRRTAAAIGRGGPWNDILQADNLALYYAWVGDVDGALRWEREARKLTSATASALMINTKVFEKVRRDPRFSRGLAAINEDVWRRINTPPLVLR